MFNFLLTLWITGVWSKQMWGGKESINVMGRRVRVNRQNNYFDLKLLNIYIYYRSCPIVFNLFFLHLLLRDLKEYLFPAGKLGALD